MLLNQIPIDHFPPRLEKFTLASDAEFGQPHVFPCIDAHEWYNVHTAQRLLGARFLLCGCAKCADLVQRLNRVDIVRVEIVRLPSVVSGRQRRASKVRGHDAQMAIRSVVGLHKPDEARAKHGFGSSEEGLAQRVERREVPFDMRLKVFSRLQADFGGGNEAVEEEVIVVGHAGDVEGVGLGGVAGKLDGERLGFLVVVGEACRAAVSLGGAWRQGAGAVGVPAVSSLRSSIRYCW